MFRSSSKLSKLFIVPIGVLCSLGCGDNQAPEDATALLSRIEAENYRSFARAPGYETRRVSEAPHGDQVDIYINATIQEALAAGVSITEWPVGSLIVKDGFTEDGELELIAVMDKRQDGWFYAEYFDREAKFSGKPSVCVDCHAAGDDFVRAFTFP